MGVAFHIGSIAIHWYGIILVIGILAAIFLARSETKRRGDNPGSYHHGSGVHGAAGVHQCVRLPRHRPVELLQPEPSQVLLGQLPILRPPTIGANG